jgi:hypothetical protein
VSLQTATLLLEGAWAGTSWSRAKARTILAVAAEIMGGDKAGEGAERR